MRTPCYFLVAVVYLSLGLISWGAEHPNVLLILVDDLKPALGCYGDPHAKTPHLDALAKRSMRFDLAYCNQAVCAPSRFTLMLGAHSTTTGLYGLGSQLREIVPKAVTMPQYFAKHGGYRTESLGKVFHIGHGNYGDPQSFSVPHFHDKVIEYLDPRSTEGGKLTREEAYFTNQKLGAIRSLPRGAAYESPTVEDDAYADGRVANEAVRRLQQAAQRQDKQPFFITVGFARPHLPFSAPRKYWDLHDPEQLPLPTYEQLPANAPPVAGKRGGEITNYSPVPTTADANYDVALKRKLIHGYYASTSFVDAQIGKVLHAVDQLGLQKNTIIVLWGDHGFHLGDLGIWTKHTNYEQANRIPILISVPGMHPGGTSTGQPTESVDLFPTLAELAGLPKPDVPQSLDGVSLVPVLKDPQKRVRTHAYHAYPRRKLGRAIRTERYRLVEWRAIGADLATAEYELYDYETDPLETRNLASERPQVLAKLKTILEKYPPPVSSRPQKSRDQAPRIANQALTISGHVHSPVSAGVIVAHGGRQYGYAVHLLNGRLAFDVRLAGKVTRTVSAAVPKEFDFQIDYTKSAIVLRVNQEEIRTESPGLIPIQPQDGMQVGRDDLSAAGDYTAPNPLQGTVRNLKVRSHASRKP